MRHLVLGVTGQDGLFLANSLLADGNHVIGVSRNSNDTDFQRLLSSYSQLSYHNADILDTNSIYSIIEKTNPDVIYNMAGFTHIGDSFNQPLRVFEANTTAVVNLLERMRNEKCRAKFVQASSYEIFAGHAHRNGGTVNENSSISPISPYSISKAATYQMCQLYRDKYDMPIYNLIYSNHESYRRTSRYVTKKLTSWIKYRVTTGDPVPVYLGYLDAIRDFGSAIEYMNATKDLPILYPTPGDYMLSTRVGTSVRSLLETLVRVFLREEILWYGNDTNETGLINGDVAVRIDPALYRPTDVPKLIGDSANVDSDIICLTHEAFIKDFTDMVNK